MRSERVKRIIHCVTENDNKNRIVIHYLFLMMVSAKLWLMAVSQQISITTNHTAK